MKTKARELVGLSALVALAVGLWGCAYLPFAGVAGDQAISQVRAGVDKEGPTNWSRNKAASYEGSQCEDVYFDLERYDENFARSLPDERDESASLDDHALLAVCKQHVVAVHDGSTEREYGQIPSIEWFDVVDYYLDIDDRDYDPLEVALMSVYADIGYMDRWSDMEIEEHPAQLRGAVHGLTQLVDERQLEQRLGETHLSEGAVDNFLRLYDEALANAETERDRMDEGERTLVYDIPERVVEQRQQDYDDYAELYDRFDELELKLDSAVGTADERDELEADLLEVRGDFLSRCDADDCMTHNLYQRISGALFQVYVAGDRATAIQAELAAYDRLYDGEDPHEVIQVADEINADRVAAGTPMYNDHREFRSALDDGADESAARAMIDDRPMIENHPYHYALGAAGSTLDPPLSGITLPTTRSGEVASVDVSGDVGEVDFATRTDTRTVRYDCVETNRVDQVLHDGTVIYRKDCKTRQEPYEHDDHPPIELPANEARTLDRGDEIRFVVDRDTDNNAANLVDVQRHDETVNVRTHDVD